MMTQLHILKKHLQFTKRKKVRKKKTLLFLPFQVFKLLKARYQNMYYEEDSLKISLPNLSQKKEFGKKM